MDIKKILEINSYFTFPCVIYTSIQYLKNKCNLKIPLPNKKGIVFSLGITKLINSIQKNNDNIGLISNIYISQLKKEQINYITTALSVFSLHKIYGSKLSNSFYEALYIISISKIIYDWSYNHTIINKPFKNFLDINSGLSFSTISKYRNEMQNTGWVSKKTSNPSGNFYDLLLVSIPSSLKKVSKIIFLKTLIEFSIKNIFYLLKYKNLKKDNNFKHIIVNNFKHIIFLSCVFQSPIFLVGLYNSIFKTKPNKLFVYLWALLSGFPIFLLSKNLKKSISLFVFVNLLTYYINYYKINIPNSYIIDYSLLVLLKKYNKKINFGINKLLNL